MAYISADDVSCIRKALKEKFPKFKFSAKKGSGSYSVNVTIKSGPLDFIKDYNNTITETNDIFACKPVEGNVSINQYWYQEHFTGNAKEVIAEVLNIIKTAPSKKWYDNSDITTDYFDTAYYINLNIGAYNKPYTVING
jgi:hypothetical protein